MESEPEDMPEMELEIVDLTTPVPPAPGRDSGAADARPQAGNQSGREFKPAPRDAPRDAKSGPPSAMEWQDFIGGTVLRLLTEGYLQVVLFKDIDESLLTERERDLIRLSRDDLKDMAAPMAGFANKSKIARKHGRAIIAAGDSYESLIDLLVWARRVNKIAKKYRPAKQKTVKGKVEDNGQVSGQDEQAADDYPSAGPFIYNPGTG